MITYNDFEKLDLRIATITEAQAIEGSNKLLRLQVDIGNESRQIIAGIAKNHSPENLIGKQIVVLTNLEYRSLMGHESQGMLLAAHNDDKPVLLIPETETDSGSSIK